MSRIGIGANLMQPNQYCMKCKYWKFAEKKVVVTGEDGRCTLGYCKKRKNR